jgi:hypothetical protein
MSPQKLLQEPSGMGERFPADNDASTARGGFPLQHSVIPVLQCYRASSRLLGPSDYNSSVLRKGRPRWPLNCLRRRRSDELWERWLPRGATRMLSSRRYRRPANQSSHEMGLSIGITGTGHFEFIAYLLHQGFKFINNAVVGRRGQPHNLVPIHLDSTGEGDHGKFAGACAGLLIG